MTLPGLPETFRWTREPWGAVLRCVPLEGVARHGFTSRQLRLSPEEGADLMDSVCTQIKRRRMPLREYTWMHWGAKLSEDEVKRLCAWAGDTADQLMASH